MGVSLRPHTSGHTALCTPLGGSSSTPAWTVGVTTRSKHLEMAGYRYTVEGSCVESAGLGMHSDAPELQTVQGPGNGKLSSRPKLADFVIGTLF